MIIVTLVLFVILFFIVRSYRECMGGGTVSGGASNTRSGGGVAGESYKNEPSLDSASKELSPSYGRLVSIFKYCSPESWPFADYNPTMAINVSSKKFDPNTLKSLSLVK